MFSFILDNMFIFREEPLDDEMKEDIERGVCFRLSINILYFIYNNLEENKKNLIGIKRKRSGKNKQSCFERRKIILELIKEKTDKLSIKAETIEKGVFRHFLHRMEEDVKKGDNDDFTKTINKYKDFCEELKIYKNQYNSDLMIFLFEKPEFRELYDEYKKKYKNNWKEIYEKSKKKNNVEIYKFYVPKFELIYNPNLNLEENFPNSFSNNVQNKSNLNNHLLNDKIVQNEDIKKTKKSVCINLKEKKDLLETNNNLNENNRNSFDYLQSFDENSFRGHYFNFPSVNHSFGINDENNNENLLKSENSSFNPDNFNIKK